MPLLTCVDIANNNLEFSDQGTATAVVTVNLPNGCLVSSIQVEGDDVRHIELNLAEGRHAEGAWQKLLWSALAIEDQQEGQCSYSVVGACDELRVGFTAAEPTKGLVIDRISVNGYLINTRPQSEVAFPLLNLRQTLKNALADKDNHGLCGSMLRQSLMDCEFLCGMVLMNARKLVQALEIWRLCEAQLLEAGDALPVDGHLRLLGMALFSAHVLASNQDKSSASLKHYVNAIDRYQALRSCVPDYDPMPIFTSHPGVPQNSFPPMQYWGDFSTSLSALQPDLIAMLLYCLRAPVCREFELLKEVVVRTLQSVLDALGCAIGWQYPDILQSLLEMHTSFRSLGDPDLLSEYDRLLETCYGLIPKVHPKALLIAFENVVIPIVEGDGMPSTLTLALRFMAPLMNRSHGRMPANVIIKLLYIASSHQSSLQSVARKLLQICITLCISCIEPKSLLSFVEWCIMVISDDPLRGPPTPTKAPPLQGSARNMSSTFQGCRMLASSPQPSPPCHSFSPLQTSALQLLAAIAKKILGHYATVALMGSYSFSRVRATIRTCACCQNSGNGSPRAILGDPRCDVSCPCADIDRENQELGPGNPGPDATPVPSIPAPESLLAMSSALGQLMPTLVGMLRGALDSQDARLLPIVNGVWPCLEAISALMQAHFPEFCIADVLRPIMGQALTLCIHTCPSESHQQVMRLLLRHIEPGQDMAPFFSAYLMALCQWLPNTLHDTSFDLLRILIGAIGTFGPPATVLSVIDALADASTPRNAASTRLHGTLVHTIISNPPYFEATLKKCVFDAASQQTSEAVAPPPHQQPHPTTVWAPPDTENQPNGSVRMGLFLERLQFARRCVVHYARQVKVDDCLPGIDQVSVSSLSFGESPSPAEGSPAAQPESSFAFAHSMDFTAIVHPRPLQNLPVEVLEQVAAPLGDACATFASCPHGSVRSAAITMVNAVAPHVTKNKEALNATLKALDAHVAASLRCTDGALGLKCAILAHQVMQSIVKVGDGTMASMETVQRVWIAVQPLLNAVHSTVHRAAFFCFITWSKAVANTFPLSEVGRSPTTQCVAHTVLDLISSGSWQWQLAAVYIWGAWTGLVPKLDLTTAYRKESEKSHVGHSEADDIIENVWTAVVKTAMEADAQVAEASFALCVAAGRLPSRGPTRSGMQGSSKNMDPPTHAVRTLHADFPPLARRRFYISDRLEADWEDMGDQDGLDPSLPLSRDSSFTVNRTFSRAGSSFIGMDEVPVRQVCSPPMVRPHSAPSAPLSLRRPPPGNAQPTSPTPQGISMRTRRPSTPTLTLQRSHSDTSAHLVQQGNYRCPEVASMKPTVIPPITPLSQAPQSPLGPHETAVSPLAPTVMPSATWPSAVSDSPSAAPQLSHFGNLPKDSLMARRSQLNSPSEATVAVDIQNYTPPMMNPAAPIQHIHAPSCLVMHAPSGGTPRARSPQPSRVRSAPTSSDNKSPSPPGHGAMSPPRNPLHSGSSDPSSPTSPVSPSSPTRRETLQTRIRKPIMHSPPMSPRRSGQVDRFGTSPERPGSNSPSSIELDEKLEGTPPDSACVWRPSPLVPVDHIGTSAPLASDGQIPPPISMQAVDAPSTPEKERTYRPSPRPDMSPSAPYHAKRYDLLARRPQRFGSDECDAGSSDGEDDATSGATSGATTDSPPTIIEQPPDTPNVLPIPATAVDSAPDTPEQFLTVKKRGSGLWSERNMSWGHGDDIADLEPDEVDFGDGEKGETHSSAAGSNPVDKEHRAEDVCNVPCDGPRQHGSATDSEKIPGRCSGSGGLGMKHDSAENEKDELPPEESQVAPKELIFEDEHGDAEDSGKKLHVASAQSAIRRRA